jgi:hypothetical protein
VRGSGFPMESSLESEARAVLVSRLGGARRDVAGVARYLDCCPLSPDGGDALPVLLAACDCLDEAIARLGDAEPSMPSVPSAPLDEPVDDGQ